MRKERDSMGEVEIPDGALWGAQTQRAVENFPISGRPFGRSFLRALGLVKRSCARANLSLGLFAPRLGEAIVQACNEVIEGRWDDQFPVDVFQTGSGTSTNMNANEVIANRAIQILGGEVGRKDPVHPNDHVNRSQSSNDVIPTVIHVAAVLAMKEELLPALENLRTALEEKAVAFESIVKTGRTHLQDATPIRLGQEFGGWAAQVGKGIARVKGAMSALHELPLGGTAVGSGINRPEKFPALAIEDLYRETGEAFFEARNHFEANASRDGAVEASGALKTVAVSLIKIADDIRWLGSGPRAGLGELRLPAVQPGSSIMPGKVNPVMAEALIMAASQVIGNDAAVTQGGLGGRFELNTMMPLIAANLLESVSLLARSAEVFTTRCVKGLQVDEGRARESVERSLALATALAPHVGYDKAAEIAKEAHRSGRTVQEVALEMSGLSAEILAEILDPEGMTEPEDRQV
ncbi:MAG: class II fumarate hydratase [Planctomycetota bacterium]|jgi:fumarate hydratase class II